MSTLDRAAEIVQLEHEAIPEWTVTIVGFIDGSGRRIFRYIASGDVSLDPVIYALESIKHDFLHRE